MDVVHFVGCNRCIQRETITVRIIELARSHLELPSRIEVIFTPLSDNVYGGIDQHYANRFGINYSLDPKEIVTIIIHELIHIEQRQQHRLEITRSGTYRWLGKNYTSIHSLDMSVESYNSLPWEHEVRVKLPDLVKKILDNKS